MLTCGDSASGCIHKELCNKKAKAEKTRNKPQFERLVAECQHAPAAAIIRSQVKAHARHSHHIWVHAGAGMQTARTHHTQTQTTYTNVCSMCTLAQCKRVQQYGDRQYHSHDLFEGRRIRWARTNLAPMFFLLLFLLFLLYITRVRIYFDSI